MSNGDESFCYIPPIDLNKRYLYSTIYAKYPSQENHIVAVGVIALSDIKNDHYIIQFFKDHEIEVFFEEEIIDHFDNFSEKWLIESSCKQFKDDFFFGTPFVLAGDSAEKVCRFIHDAYEEKGYVMTDDHEKLF